jgi:hypothetical protein
MNFDNFGFEHRFNDILEHRLNERNWDLLELEDDDTEINEYREEILKSYQINEFLEVKLVKINYVFQTENGKKPRVKYISEIYINSVEFIQCMFLLLEIPKEDPRQEIVDSIDEAEKYYSKDLEYNKKRYKIDPETEFWAHCSNLQAWAENEYNTRILHRNIAFPLLKKLTEVGDPKAKKRFKEEIAERYEKGGKQVQIFLEQEGYLNFLTKEEREVLMPYGFETKGYFDTKERRFYKIGKDKKFLLTSYIDDPPSVFGPKIPEQNKVNDPTNIDLLEKEKERIVWTDGEDVFDFIPNEMKDLTLDEFEEEIEKLTKLLEDDEENGE